MNPKDIENSMKKIDLKFMEELSAIEKRQAVQMFRLYYAEEMGKAAFEMLKYQKVQHNLGVIQECKQRETRQIEENLRKKMQTHQSNREKSKQQKMSLIKKYEDNWRARWEQISRKKLREREDIIQKVEERWKQTEQFWNGNRKLINVSPLKKQHKREIKRAPPQDQIFRNYSIQEDFFKKQNKREYLLSRIDRQRGNFKSKTSRNMRMMSDTIVSQDDLVKKHQEKYQEKNGNDERQNLTACICKLMRIEERRQVVRKKQQQNIEEAKSVRQKRQNPEVIEKNKRNSEHYHSTKSRPCRNSTFNGRQTNQIPFDPRKLSKTIEQRRQLKSRMDELQSEERQESLLVTMQKIRHSKLERIVKKAVASLRHETLSPVP